MAWTSSNAPICDHYAGVRTRNVEAWPNIGLQFSIDLNPAHLTLWRGHRSPCVTYLWDAELRPGNAGTWDGSIEVLDTCFAAVPPDIRELRVRADAGFGFNPVFVALEALSAQYTVVARLTQAFKRLLPGFELPSC